MGANKINVFLLSYFSSQNLLFTNMIIFPNAKINLGLNVIKRRADGFHNIETVLYPVKIKDALEIVEAADFVFSSSGLPSGNPGENLCVKAWNLIAQNYAIPGAHIHLHKQIPVGAGLGGGSADAAFCLRLINEKFQLGMSIFQMQDYARILGSDCAFFIENKPVFADGKGDQFQNIDLNLDKYYLVLAMPPVHVNTAEAYHGIKPAVTDFSLNRLPDLPVKEWRETVKNAFEDTIFKKHPIIEKLKDSFYNSGALYASMSGSGASVYGIFEKEVRLPELEQNNVLYYGI